MRILYSIVLLCILSFQTKAQELNISVKVAAPTATKTDPKIFDKLEQDISTLLNNSIWTQDEFQVFERIEGNLQINITEEVSSNSFKAEMILKTSRPIYNGTYTSSIINYVDKGVVFTYDGVTPLAKTSDGYIDNLSSILSFYAYFMIGMDYDTFKRSSGTEYFNKARDIYNNLPSNIQRSGGWDPTSSNRQNRYFLLENVTSPKFKPYRDAMYDYHRLGMDTMYEDNGKARAVILGAITTLGEVNQNYNNAILLKMFSDAKRKELVDIFSIAEKGQKTRVIGVMTEIDPSQSSAYKSLR